MSAPGAATARSASDKAAAGQQPMQQSVHVKYHPLQVVCCGYGWLVKEGAHQALEGTSRTGALGGVLGAVSAL